LVGVEQLLWDLARQLGFVGVFLISFIGASSVIIPIPYTVVILWLGLNMPINPYMLAAVAGLGSAVGELSGYILGYAAKHVVSEKRKRKFDAMLKILMRHKNIWPLLIFLFALTPLPDDILFVPLGLLHFNFLRAFIPCIIGKLAMFYMLVFGGKYLGGIASSLVGGGGPVTTLVFTVITFAALLVTVFVIWKIDWEKVLEKYETLIRTTLNTNFSR
jgi:membrane protein YqaA with SNARE-associated domain